MSGFTSGRWPHVHRRALCRPRSTHADLAEHSAIEWAAATWNPTTGCDRISRGCDHCYALSLAGRLKAMGTPSINRMATRERAGRGSPL